MKEYHIAVIVGSPRRDSYNQHLADALVKLAPVGFSFYQVQIRDLPLYNQDDDENPKGPVVQMKKEIQKADGILIVTPEYNRSIPGVLKNALDQGSRPPGQNIWAKKPAGILGVSPGASGTAMSQQHLRNVLSYLDMPVLRQPEAYLQLREGMFDSAGNIGEGSRSFLQKWMDAYVSWIEKNAG